MTIRPLLSAMKCLRRILARVHGLISESRAANLEARYISNRSVWRGGWLPGCPFFQASSILAWAICSAKDGGERSSIRRTDAGETSGNPRSDGSSTEMDGKEVAGFIIGVTFEDILKFSVLCVDLTNRNEVEDIRQILAFSEAFRMAHCVELEGNQMKRFGDRKGRTAKIQHDSLGIPRTPSASRAAA